MPAVTRIWNAAPVILVVLSLIAAIVTTVTACSRAMERLDTPHDQICRSAGKC